ncbi:MAG: zinc-dependent metalloprotease [Proteobacteria bacterium]|nr:zinc-dependent metalloprotease [Pseudomonadota bacterium]
MLTLPNNDSIALSTTNFTPGEGYYYPDDDEIEAGAPPFHIAPGINRNQLSYSWKLPTDGYDIIINFNKGLIYAYINGNSDRFIIKKSTSSEQYIMKELNLPAYPFDDGDPQLQQRATSRDRLNPPEDVHISHLKSFRGDLAANARNVNAPLNMLILWDEDARLDEGGDPLDPSDTLGIDTLIQTAVDHSNMAFTNSSSQTRVVSFHTAKLNGFPLSTTTTAFDNDVLLLQDNATVQALRNQVGADVVSLLSGVNAFDWGACGYAFVQTHSQCGYTNGAVPDCGDGADFEDYPYNITTTFCAIEDDSFTHELGHLLGANHSRSDFQFNAAWRIDVINNGYPEAFGYQQSSFYSIMTIQSVSTRSLYFSNPAVTSTGIPTGVAGTRHNQLTIDSLSPTMAAFRQRPDLIFSSGFE